MSYSIAQPGYGISYNFSQTTGVVAPTGLTLQAVTPAANQDDFGYNLAPAGMSLRFGGNTYTRFFASTNGWMTLLNAAGTPATLSTYLPNNQLSNNVSGYPIIAPYWDDLATTLISYKWVAPVLTVQWTCKINKTAGTAATNFWVTIDGSTGVVTFSYANNVYTVGGPPSASIGIAGACVGDYYSYDNVSTWADSTIETSNISVKPTNVNYIFTPYQLYDNCANARDLGPLTATCTPAMYNIYGAKTSGSAICATTDVADIWFKVVKPAGISNVTITTSSASPACQSVTGTSIEAFASCGGPSIGCATTSVANPGFGEVTLSRGACVAETLYVRVTADGDVGGKFNICAKDAGSGGGPVGSTCGNPNWICSLPLSYTGTTTGFGSQYDSANSVCHDPFMNGEDYVFAYTPASNICLRLSLNSTGLNPGVFVFDGCPNLLGSTHCIASAVNSVGNATINSVSLTAGITYYFLVDNDTLSAAPNSIPFDINITSVGTSQTYDACGALSLGNIPFNQTCNYVSYNTECATPSVTSYVLPGCGNFTNSLTGDIWFSFTTTFTGNLLINSRPGSVNPSSDIAMAVYTGNCVAFTLVACDDNSAGSNMPALSIPVISGTTYYIRAWTVAPNNTGTFDLCFTGACSPPNDLPCASVLVNLGSSISGTNLCAGSSGEPANSAQCVPSGTINTVWYKAVVPASGSLKIRTHTRSLADTQIEAFRFLTGCANASSSFVRIGCNDDGPDCGVQDIQSWHDFSELTLTGQTPGDTIFIAVDGYNSQSGTFDITVIDGTSASFPPIAGADCGGAYDVCGSTSIVANDPGILGYGNVCDFTASYDCWANGERNSAWYRFSVNPGTLQFDIQTFSDYDFILWDITGVSNPCAMIQAHTLPSTRCSWQTTTGGHTGISIPDPTIDWEPALPVAGTRTFLLNIDNWNPPFQTTGYTIDWMGSPISTTTASVQWQGAVDTSYSNINNWGTIPCNGVPSCNVDAVISTTVSGRQPTISANSTVRNLTINGGAVLRIKSPFTLDVCGDFVNNGTLIAEPGSTVRFIGTIAQSIGGNLTGANSFANLTIDKPASSGSVTLNSNIDVAQNFLTNNGTSIFNINGKYMKVKGNFTNFNGTGTFTGTGYSTVEFNGTTGQSFTNNNGSISLNRVVMNKPGGKLYLTGPNSNMNIDSMLTLTSGIIYTRNLTTLEVNIKHYLPAAIIGPLSAASYIDGKLRRKISAGIFSSPIIPASYDFPVGDSLNPGGYELANIQFTSVTLITDVLATFDSWPAGPPLTGPVAYECMVATYSNKPIFNNGYWTFKRTGTNVSGKYSVSLFNTGFTNNTGQGWTVAKADILSDPSLVNSWTLTGNCVVTSTAANTQRINFNPAPGTDSLCFNHYYATVQTEMILPIELLYFNAEPHGDEVFCTWETSSEINNQYFDVERSKNGKDFEPIGRVLGFGIGTTTEKRKYSLTDPDHCEGIIYYRLKQVDIDGAYSYSDLVAVNCVRDRNLITIYPNPAKSEIFSSFFEEKNGTVLFQWLDAPGKIVKEETHAVVKGYNTIKSDVSDLSNGIYFLRIREVGKDSYEADRLVKLLKN